MCPCRQPSGKIGPIHQAMLWFGCGFVALWRSDFVRLLAMSAVIVGMVWFFLMATGCKAVPAQSSRPPVNSAPVIAGQLGKDATIIEEAAKIDAISPEAKPHTDAQRAAVAANPAQDVAKLVAEFEKRQNEAAKETAAIIAGLRKEVEDLKSQALREQARWLTWSGVALLGAFGLSIAFGQLAAAVKTWPLALLGVGCFGLAQLISHPWFLRSFVGLLAAAVAYAAYYVYDRHNEGRLRRSLEKKAAVLAEVVPVLDDAYDNAAESVKAALDANVFSRLKDALTKDQRAEIHALRAENVAKT